MYAPAGTSREIVARMSGEVQKILRLPDVAKRFYDLAFLPGGSDPEAFTRIVKREYERWEPIVRSVGVQLEL
jgi:tripartite-type tricarboxylate transporter receptor subunit TctC